MKKDLLIAQEEISTSFSCIYKSAIKKLLNEALKDRNNDRIYTLIGFCYKKTNKINKAISYFEKAALLNTESFSAFFQMGLCGLKIHKTCVAVNSFIKAIQSNPTNPYSVLYLGIAHEYCEEPDMALMVYERLIETTPKFTKAYEKKAELLMKLSHYSDAIPLLNKMIKYNPNNVRAYENLGNCYKKLGKQNYAYRCYRKILTTSSEPEIYAKAVSALREISAQPGRRLQREKIKLCSKI